MSELSVSPVVCVSAPTRKARVVRLLLDGTTRGRNGLGKDYMSQILWMRLDGISCAAIAEALGCCEEVVSAAVLCWQTQVEEREERDGTEFVPLMRNRRRWKAPRPVLPISKANPTAH